MVLIENDEIPVRGVDPFVIGLDAAGLLVYTEKILKRAEADDGPGFIRLSVLLIVCQTAGLKVRISTRFMPIFLAS